MKCIVVLYAGGESLHQFDILFDGKSAFDRCLAWAGTAVPKAAECPEIVVLTVPKLASFVSDAVSKAAVTARVVVKPEWTARLLCTEIRDACKKQDADAAVYTWSDCPFLNDTLTAELVRTHTEYEAEYTFADGYPYGFAPEIIAGTTAGILAELPAEAALKKGAQPVSRESLFDMIKTDINSFEIETVIADTDWRMYRFSFACGSRAGVLACSALYPVVQETEDVEKITARAAQMPEILQTVPAFYNVQITGSYGSAGSCTYCPYPDSGDASVQPPAEPMTVQAFKTLVPQMTALSETAVVGLSAWGEPLCHKDFIAFVQAVLSEPGLSVLIETDGLYADESVASAIKELVSQAPSRTCGTSPVIWIVSIDACTAETYKALHKGCEHADEYLKKACDAVALLQKFFPGDVYPQLVRTSRNENELEQFYRYWSSAESPSGGKLIIQKYDWFCGLLPQDKPADLAPIERNPCWHLRRDMTILADGRVPSCRELVCGGSVGNVFNEGIADVWKKTKTMVEAQIKKNYSEKCRVCDEYYTFNF